jgi:hypothetical protein
VDPANGAPRSWFDPTATPVVRPPFAPREVVRRLLQQSAEVFRWPSGLADLRDAALVERPHGWSARLTQEFKGLPVDVSEVIVNVTADGRPLSGYNQYHYDIPATLDPARVRIGPTEARAQVARLAAPYLSREIGRPALIVHRYQPVAKKPPKPSRRPAGARARFLQRVRAALARGRRPRLGEHVLAWDVRFSTEQPRGRWRVLIDATTGRLIDVRDLVAYAQAPQGKGSVFDPNPIVSSGDLTLSSKSPAAKLNAQRVPVTLLRLDPAPADGRLRLDGAWVHMEDFVKPHLAEPSSPTGAFVFSATDRDFLDVMVYFHIDRFQQYVQTTLALPDMGSSSVRADPQGENGADGSTGGGNGLSFGAGGVDDASDAMIVLHEYGHFLQDAAKPGSAVGNFPSGVAEGFCDFLAAVYYDDKHADPAATRGHMFSWDANPVDGFWEGRRYDSPLLLSGNAFEDLGGYEKGEVWCSTMFELYRKLGGDSSHATRRAAARDLAIRLHLVANGGVPETEASVTQMAQAIGEADANLGGWRYPDLLHQKVIDATFSRRAVPSYSPPPVDVYVDDGRGGGYGSASGQDAFNETLWKENHGDAPDVWVRAVAAPGTPADHQGQVPVNTPAFVFARVRNRGATASGPITVRAFSSAPGSPRRWPVDWTELPAPPGPMPNTVAAAPDAGVIVGPFPWTPARTGRQAILVVVESAEDRAVTQNLPAGAPVAWMDLVPFDNNLAVREVRATRA